MKRTSESLVLGIELGSVGVKVALCGSDGNLIRTTTRINQGRPIPALLELLERALRTRPRCIKRRY